MQMEETKNFFYKNRNLIAGLFLVVFSALFLYQNVSYINSDRAPRITDFHYVRSLDYYRKFIGKDPGANLSFNPFPPAAYVVSLGGYAIGGEPSMHWARISISIFSLIFLLSLFGIGHKLGGYWSGAAVMALGASSPYILYYSRSFHLDFPQAATAALAFYVLLLSEGYEKRVQSILFGLALALAFLTKWSTAFFLAAPILYFLIPRIFKSIKSFIIFILFSAVSAVSIRGIYSYYVNPDNYTPWTKIYLLYALIPAIICILIIHIFDRFFKVKPKEKTDVDSKPVEPEDTPPSKTVPIINFCLSSFAFALTTLPWYLWAAPVLRRKFSHDMGYYRGPEILGPYLMKFLVLEYNFAWFFIIIGLIFLFIDRDKRFLKFSLPVSLIGAFLIILKIGIAEERYILSLIIFTAALGGYWVRSAGKLKIPLTVIIVAISLTSILAWTFIPGNLAIYRRSPRFDERLTPSFTSPKLMKTEPPNQVFYNLKPLFNYVYDGNDYYFRKVLVLYEPGNPLTSEFIAEQMFLNNLPFSTIHIWNLRDIDARIGRMNSEPASRREIEGITDVVIVLRKEMKTADVEEKIKGILGRPQTSETFEPDGEIVIRALKFN